MPAVEVVVPSPEPDSPAHRALEMEGVPHREHLCTGLNDYGELLYELWNEGKPFVVCEWDVIPWPGAIEALIECPRPRCSHRYPLQVGHLALSFGIGKYVPQGPAPENWPETEWRMLDGQVVPVLNARLGPVHIHEPPVAHARASVLPTA